MPVGSRLSMLAAALVAALLLSVGAVAFTNNPRLDEALAQELRAPKGATEYALREPDRIAGDHIASAWT